MTPLCEIGYGIWLVLGYSGKYEYRVSDIIYDFGDFPTIERQRQNVLEIFGLDGVAGAENWFQSMMFVLAFDRGGREQWYYRDTFREKFINLINQGDKRELGYSIVERFGSGAFMYFVLRCEHDARERLESRLGLGISLFDSSFRYVVVPVSTELLDIPSYIEYTDAFDLMFEDLFGDKVPHSEVSLKDINSVYIKTGETHNSNVYKALGDIDLLSILRFPKYNKVDKLTTNMIVKYCKDVLVDVNIKQLEAMISILTNQYFNLNETLPSSSYIRAKWLYDIWICRDNPSEMITSLLYAYYRNFRKREYADATTDATGSKLQSNNLLVIYRVYMFIAKLVYKELDLDFYDVHKNIKFENILPNDIYELISKFRYTDNTLATKNLIRLSDLNVISNAVVLVLLGKKSIDDPSLMLEATKSAVFNFRKDDDLISGWNDEDELEMFNIPSMLGTELYLYNPEIVSPFERWLTLVSGIVSSFSATSRERRGNTLRITSSICLSYRFIECLVRECGSDVNVLDESVVELLENYKGFDESLTKKLFLNDLTKTMLILPLTLCYLSNPQYWGYAIKGFEFNFEFKNDNYSYIGYVNAVLIGEQKDGWFFVPDID